MEKVKEFCQECGEFVMIDATLGTIQQCPICGGYILACSLCGGGVCSKCKLERQRSRKNSAMF